MVSETNSQLIKLLERHRNDAVASACLETILEADEVRYCSTVLLPLEQTIDIYSIRAKINAELRGGSIKGYDTLLPALKGADVSSIKLQALELLDRHLVIFTDEAVSCLFGVLNCPKEKPAWFHPGTGYD